MCTGLKSPLNAANVSTIPVVISLFNVKLSPQLIASNEDSKLIFPFRYPLVNLLIHTITMLIFMLMITSVFFFAENVIYVNRFKEFTYNVLIDGIYHSKPEGGYCLMTNSTEKGAAKGKEYTAAYKAVPAASYKMPKSSIRITLPEGVQDLKLFKFAEISAPGGVTMILRLPFPMSESGLGKIAEAIKQQGGTMELQDE